MSVHSHSSDDSLHSAREGRDMPVLSMVPEVSERTTRSVGNSTNKAPSIIIDGPSDFYDSTADQTVFEVTQEETVTEEKPSDTKEKRTEEQEGGEEEQEAEEQVPTREARPPAGGIEAATGASSSEQPVAPIYESLLEESQLITRWAGEMRALTKLRGERGSIQDQLEIISLKSLQSALIEAEEARDLRVEAISCVISVNERRKMKSAEMSHLQKKEREIMYNMKKLRSTFATDVFRRERDRKAEVIKMLAAGPYLVSRFGSLIHHAGKSALLDAKEFLLVRLHTESNAMAADGDTHAPPQHPTRVSRAVVLSVLDVIPRLVGLTGNQLTMEHVRPPSETPEWICIRASDCPWAFGQTRSAVVLNMISKVVKEFDNISGLSALRALARVVDAAHPGFRLHAKVLGNADQAEQLVVLRLKALDYDLPEKGGLSSKTKTTQHGIRKVLQQVGDRMRKQARFYIEVRPPQNAEWCIGLSADTPISPPFPGKNSDGIGFRWDGAIVHDGVVVRYTRPLYSVEMIGLLIDVHVGSVTLFGDGENFGVGFGAGAEFMRASQEHITKMIKADQLLPAFAIRGLPTSPYPDEETINRSGNLIFGKKQVTPLRRALSHSRHSQSSMSQLQSPGSSVSSGSRLRSSTSGDTTKANLSVESINFLEDSSRELAKSGRDRLSDDDAADESQALLRRLSTHSIKGGQSREDLSATRLSETEIDRPRSVSSMRRAERRKSRLFFPGIREDGEKDADRPVGKKALGEKTTSGPSVGNDSTTGLEKITSEKVSMTTISELPRPLTPEIVQPQLSVNFGSYMLQYKPPRAITVNDAFSTRDVEVIKAEEDPADQAPVKDIDRARENLALDKFLKSVEYENFRSFSRFPSDSYHRNIAAKKVQRAVRRHLARRELKRFIEYRDGVVMLIQRTWRLAMARKNLAASIIQRSFLRHLTRVYCLRRRALAEFFRQDLVTLDRAASVIQTRGRRLIALQRVVAMRGLATRKLVILNIAVMTIQSAFRRYLANPDRITMLEYRNRTANFRLRRQRGIFRDGTKDSEMISQSTIPSGLLRLAGSSGATNAAESNRQMYDKISPRKSNRRRLGRQERGSRRHLIEQLTKTLAHSKTIEMSFPRLKLAFDRGDIPAEMVGRGIDDDMGDSGSEDSEGSDND